MGVGQEQTGVFMQRGLHTSVAMTWNTARQEFRGRLCMRRAHDLKAHTRRRTVPGCTHLMEYVVCAHIYDVWDGSYV